MIPHGSKRGRAFAPLITIALPPFTSSVSGANPPPRETVKTTSKHGTVISARRPEECDSLLIEALNRGDLETAVGLYEPNATLFSDASVQVVGKAAIREALKAYLGFDSRITEIRAVKSADRVLALTGGKWTSTGKDSDGKPVALSGKSVEVVRRQADGRWLFAIDNPWGAE